MGNAVSIFVHKHIFDVVEAIFNGPTLTNQVNHLFSRSEGLAADIIVRFIIGVMDTIASATQHYKTTNTGVLALPVERGGI